MLLVVLPVIKLASHFPLEAPVFSGINLCQILTVWAETFHAQCLPQMNCLESFNKKWFHHFWE